MRLRLNYSAIFFSLLFSALFFLLFSKTESKNLNPGEEEYLVAVEVMPAPVGGLESIMKKITYPDMAIRTKTEGKVYVLILINESGDVDDVKIVKGIGAGCDEEAAKAIKKTKFSPGMNKGAAVKTKLGLAISFKLQ